MSVGKTHRAGFGFTLKAQKEGSWIALDSDQEGWGWRGFGALISASTVSHAREKFRRNLKPKSVKTSLAHCGNVIAKRKVLPSPIDREHAVTPQFSPLP